MISCWEVGNTKPNIEASGRLAGKLGVSLDVLTGFHQKSNADIDKFLALADKLNEEDLMVVVRSMDRLVEKV